MKAKTIAVNPAGRVDLLAANLLKRAIQANGNPALRVAQKVFEVEINEAFESFLGPGTKADEIGQKIRKLDDRMAKAFREVQAEDAR